MFSKLPLAMPLQLALALAPWAAVAATGSFAGLLAVAGVAAGYTLLLFTQLWRLRAVCRATRRWATASLGRLPLVRARRRPPPLDLATRRPPPATRRPPPAARLYRAGLGCSPVASGRGRNLGKLV